MLQQDQQQVEDAVNEQYKREVVLSLEQIVAIFTGTTNDFISKKKYIKLLDRIEDFYVDVSEWASSSPLKLCYDERKEELRSLFERLLAFFRLKGINELNFLAWRLAFKGKLRQASKLMDFETSVIRR
uniref:NR LBD domain-containing protein n=1 Tax=Meloidogyne hapla TaxID=6305 RepID=A0A1I8BFM1_MELHA